MEHRTAEVDQQVLGLEMFHNQYLHSHCLKPLKAATGRPCISSYWHCASVYGVCLRSKQHHLLGFGHVLLLRSIDSYCGTVELRPSAPS